MVQPKLRFKREDGSEYPSLFECSIKDVSSIKNGPFGSVLHSSDYVLEGTPIITTEHFKSGIIQSDVSTIPKVSEEDYKRLKGYVLETGDIVFSRVGSIDINALVTERENGWLFSGRVIRVRLNGSYHSGYFHYLLSTQRVKNDIVARAVGQTMPSINSEILNLTSLMITTSYEEQQKIADFLSTVDEVIAQSEAEVRNLEQQKRAAMQKIFSQEVRLKRDDGTEFPEWEEKSLKDCTNFIKDGTHGTHKDVEQGYYLLSAKDVFNGAIHIGEDSRIISQDDFNSIYKQYSLAVGDVILTIVGTLGRTAVITEKYVKVVFQRSVAILRPNSLADSYYLRYTMENNSFQNELEIRKSKGAQAGVYLGTLAEIEIPFPCLEEQQKIADFLSAYDDAISCAKQELDKWKELKKGLLQQMFV